jgi:adenylate cyclase
VQGERKQVTVLFADVVGSMNLAAGMDPEEWGELMERFFAIVRKGVNRFDGRIDKFTGDGVMALFGAPIAYEDHARRACAAAVDLRAELADYGQELERQHDIAFVVRMGLNSGEVVAGSVGEDLTVEYTAVGTTVGLAQRMESLAEPGSVYLTAATAALVQGYFEVNDLGPMQAKGVEAPVHVFELLGPGGARTPLDVAKARGFSRFVGRGQELAALDEAFAEASQGRGQVVGVMAEPGVGKSRLCHELEQRRRAEGVDVFVAHGLAHARTVPFLPILEIVRAQFAIGEGDEPAAARDKVTGSLRELGATLDEEMIAILFDFLGIPDPERPPATIDPEARQRQLFEGFSRLRQARSARSPFVAIFEDAHWLDPGSMTVLEQLVTQVAGLRCLLVVTFRPEYQPPWADRSHYRQLSLSPLAEDAAVELVRELLGPHPSLDGVAELVTERTGGNPFFIEEVIQDLAENGVISGQRGRYELAQTIDTVKIPVTVKAVLAARIDRLSHAEKELLQTAAVIGRQFSGRLLGRVSEVTGPALEDGLRALVEAELITRPSIPTEDGYAFKHALTEEVAYGSQLGKRRARTHAAVASGLAEIDSDKADERASLIAHHWETAGELLQAAQWNARAAVRAGFSHPLEAVRHWRRVRSLTDRLDPSPETIELGINSRLMLLGCHWRLGAACDDSELTYEEEAAAVFGEGRKIAEAINQPAVQVFSLALYGAVRTMSDGVVDGYELMQQSVHLADETRDPGLRVSTRLASSWNLFILGRAGEAAGVVEEMMQIMGEDRSMARGMVMTSPYAWSRGARAFFAAHCTGLEEELDALEGAISLLAEEGDVESQAHAYRNWAVIADLAGADPELALENALRGLQWADEAGGPWSRIFNREGVAISYCRRNDWDRAIEVVEEAMAIVRDRRLALADVPLLLSTRARAEIGLGDPDSAFRSATEAVAVAVRCSAGQYEVRARIELARAILAGAPGGAATAAAAELDKALSLVEALGIGSFAPQVHRVQADVALALGDEATYRRKLDEAHRLFLDVGAAGRAAEIASLVGLS